MYKQVQAESRFPQLEKDLKEARLKGFDLVKERAALSIEVKQVPKQEAEVEELKQIVVKLHGVH